MGDGPCGHPDDDRRRNGKSISSAQSARSGDRLTHVVEPLILDLDPLTPCHRFAADPDRHSP